MAGSQNITLIQMNDTHGYLEPHAEVFFEENGPVTRTAGGFARMASTVKKIKDETDGQALFFDSGDTFHGTFLPVESKGEAMIPILNVLGLDGMTGHWDFAYTPDRLKTLQQSLNYPVLACNVFDAGTNEYYFKPYIIKETGSVKAAVIGLACPYVGSQMPKHFAKGVYFKEAEKELPYLIHKVKQEENADIVILLSHQGFAQDMELLKEVRGIDVILSGHTHNRLYEPVQFGNTLVIQSGAHGSFLGRLDLKVSNGRVISHHHELIEITPDIPEDPEVKKQVENALEPYRGKLSEKAGTTFSLLFRGMNIESTTDNFLMNALLDYSGADLAFSHGWRYGAPIPPGEVTVNDLYNIVPMNPAVMTAELSGAEILLMLEEAIETTYSRDPYRQSNGYMKRGLGYKAYVKLENPHGLRVEQLFIGNEKLNPDKTYKAVYITKQGIPEKYGRNRSTLNQPAVEIMKQYLSKHPDLKQGYVGTYEII
ncbi:bifunctional metallophosphatase/5'-nucleotidase [Bacillus marinisedimentorum]|uniref:bifunctional metallophosphatase/5'-nucleotidase n=1 Tax=Bacillus marinisedimentorum TaxID=1821260 RepID=UPI0009F1E445|nr:bifunctional metallophosphatase/5'-nucleotidase [Bacillus marinisedimentorum]